MTRVLDLRCLSLLAVLAPTAGCFDVSDAPPLETETTTGTPVSTDDSTTGSMPDPTNTSTTANPSTGEDPSTSTGEDPDTSTGADGSSSSGDPPESVCGDGILDPMTEECDDGNLEAGDLCDGACLLETLVFEHTGMPQMFEVPTWVDSLEIEAWGAQGGDSECCMGPPQEDGGLGGHVSGVLPTAGGANLAIFVGGKGVLGGPGGFNGGGAAGQYGGGGGGATDIRIGPAMLGNRLFVAGGGGGGNCGCPDHGAGGNAGGLMGAPGISGQGLTPGGGGTQAAGGSAGEGGTPGQLGLGGSSPDPANLYHFAGGGGGYYGGGGAYASGAGGGSSYLGLLENGNTIAAERMGHGEVRLTAVPQ
ncbi:glycine-rich protein [Paraliomyxa miuraensis]|uniref:glycine-rich protein n=1 Tax=Paraliomyxa miuraensis TaxID=376150 RepID=UPI002253174F|nr:glycine-rich protein [Paraliomyxa miuraensis]MCX4246667.1 glycine-rich protein [Paraliomyxa miuraensis]